MFKKGQKRLTVYTHTSFKMVKIKLLLARQAKSFLDIETIKTYDSFRQFASFSDIGNLLKIDCSKLHFPTRNDPEVQKKKLQFSNFDDILKILQVLHDFLQNQYGNVTFCFVVPNVLSFLFALNIWSMHSVANCRFLGHFEFQKIFILSSWILGRFHR